MSNKFESNSITGKSIREHEDQGCRFRRITGGGLRIVLEVTSYCNLNCRHCFACSGKKELTTQELVDIVRQLPQISAEKIILTGGEPLLRNDIEEIILLAHHLGIRVDLNTNMYFFSDDRSKSLWDSGLREISTSIDGLQKYHDWFRKKEGSFQRTIDGIKRATSIGYEVDVHGVCTPSNLAQIGEIIDLCADLNVSSYTMFSVVSQGQGISQLHSKEFSLSTNDIETLYDILHQKRRQYRSTMAIRTIDIFQKPECHKCPMGQSVVGITSEGYLKPCLLAQYKNENPENLAENSLLSSFAYSQNRVNQEEKVILCSNSSK